jgi:hypothetical protein
VARCCRDEFGDYTPDLVTDGPGEWKKLVKDHLSIMGRAGIRRLGKADFHYFLEALTD